MINSQQSVIGLCVSVSWKAKNTLRTPTQPPLQRGTHLTHLSPLSLSSLSTPWHSSHAASHGHPGFLPEPRRPWHLLVVPFLGHGLMADAGPPCNATAPMKLQLSKRPNQRMAGKPPSPAEARIAAACIDFWGGFTHFLQPVDRRRELPAAQICSIQQT